MATKNEEHHAVDSFSFVSPDSGLKPVRIHYRKWRKQKKQRICVIVEELYDHQKYGNEKK